MELILERLAAHFINKKNYIFELAKNEQNVEILDPIVINFLLKIVNYIWEAVDSGSVHSAKFSGVKKNFAEDKLKDIYNNSDILFTNSIELAKHLYDVTPPQASPGLLCILKVADNFSHKKYVAILKIQIKNQKFVKLPKTTLTQMTVEDIENLLLENIQKGAIYPHPTKSSYDLKLIDQQSIDEPAKYFTEGFLGCTPKRSDDHQIRVLLRDLLKYSEKRNLPFAHEKAPDVIISLKKENRDITTSFLTRVVNEHKIYGPNFNPDDFSKYIKEDSEAGDLDIPKTQFIRRGTGVKHIQRLFIYSFDNDPMLRGLKLSGPVEIIKEIMTINGDSVTFTIRTTKNGIKPEYE